MRSVAIVGAGITGLTAAYWLSRKTDARIILIDPAPPGGKLKTLRSDGFTIDAGPDSIFVRKPGVTELIKELSLEDEVVQPQAKEFSIFAGGSLHRVPSGLTSLAAVSPEAVRETEFLSEEAKARVLEPDMTMPQGDVSVAEFFRARYGEVFSRVLAEPLLAGTHAGNPEKLSMAALYPNYLTSTPAKPTPGPTFISFRSGIECLPDRLQEKLAGIDRRTTHVRSIGREGDGVTLQGADGPILADHVLLAIPSNMAAPLLASTAKDAAREMQAIRHASSAIVTLAYDRALVNDIPEGTGFLVPIFEECPITGATWTSNKWPHRAPEDTFLVRVFLGRDGEPPVTSESDQTLVERALAGIRQTAGIDSEPMSHHVFRWPDALPQYELGHIERVARIKESLKDLPITVAGTSYGGVGIADCIRQGREAADEIVERMSL